MDIDYHALDWSGLMVPDIIKLPPKKDPRTEYTDVFRFKEYYPESFPYADLYKVLRYIPLVYDAKSPLHKVITELNKLKVVAAELAGFIRQEDGRFLSNVMDILACRDAVVNGMIIRYVVTNKSGLYSKYILYSELHFIEMEKLLSGEKGARVNDFDMLSEKLDSVRQEMFRKDNSIDIERQFNEFFFKEKLHLRPEDIAKKLKAGEKPVKAPEKKKSKQSLNQSSESTSEKTSIAS